jgi:hypothetical protein
MEGGMPKIWIGFSKTLDFEDLVTQCINPFFAPVNLDEDDEPVGRLELEFGASHISPGEFEVYENKCGDAVDFNLDHILKRLPFPDRPTGLSETDLSDVKCVFYSQSDNLPQKREDENVTISDSLEVKFDWE